MYLSYWWPIHPFPDVVLPLERRRINEGESGVVVDVQSLQTDQPRHGARLDGLEARHVAQSQVQEGRQAGEGPNELIEYLLIFVYYQ